MFRRPIHFVLVLVLVFSALLAGSAAAGRKGGNTGAEGALAAYDAAIRALADGSGSQPAIYGIIGFFGQPLPPQWLVLTDESEGSRDLHELVVSGGEIRAERRFRPVPGQDIPDIPIRRERVKVDARAAFATAEREARKGRMAFESAHFQLRCRDAGEEPVWMLSLVGPTQVSIGAVYLSAESGKVLRTAWVKPSTERLSSTRN